MLSRGILLPFLLVCLNSYVVAQNRLSFRPIEAEYSMALDRIILISASPNELHVFDPVTRTDQAVALPASPLNLSVSPNGLFAAVGHDGSVSYINLSTRSLQRTYTVNRRVERIALGSNWLHVMPSYSGSVVSVNVATGAITEVNFVYSQGGRMHPSERAIYSTRDGTSPNDIERYDTSTGPITGHTDSPYHGDYNFCGGIWYSPDGNRIYTGCGSVARYSTDPQQDMTFLAYLPGVGQIRSLVESAPAGKIALIPAAQSYFATQTDEEVRLYASANFKELGRFQLPKFTSGSNAYAAHGKWVFISSTGASLYAISQADSTSGFLNDYAIQSYPLSNPPSCFASFSPASASVPASGLLLSVEITAAAECVYQANSTGSWLQVITGGYGSGNGTMKLHARANYGGSRTATVTVGSQSFTVTQQAASGSLPALQSFSYNVLDAEYSKQLDRIVMVSSGPDELHVYDPVTGAEQYLALSESPLSVSVHPNGVEAAVGHSGFISHVDLRTMTVLRVYPIITDVNDIVLAANGYIYAFPQRDWSDIYSLQISTGTVTAVSAIYEGRVARLHKNGTSIYLGGSWASKWTARNGPLEQVASSWNSACGNLWLTEDGLRLFTQCGGVYRTSDIYSEDGSANGNLGSSITAGAHSAAWSSIAATVGENENGELRLYADDGLGLLGKTALTQFSNAGTLYRMKGRFVFWNQAGSRILVISQVAEDARLLSRDFVNSISPSALTGCNYSLPTTSSDVGSSGGPVTISVNTGGACTWTASRSDEFPWIQMPGIRTGTGSGSFVVQVAANSTATARSGDIFINGVKNTVRQAAFDGLTLSATTTSFSAAGGSATLTVTTPANRSWMVGSSASWLTLARSSGTGPASFLMTAAVNTGSPRSAVLTTGAGSLTVTQAGAAGGMRFVPVTPCRIADTRGEGLTGAFGQPSLPAGGQRDFPLPSGRCGIPWEATAYSLNVTVVPGTPLAFVTLWPTGQSRPLVSTLNSFDARVKANAAIVPAGLDGSVSVFATDGTDVILDVNGYFLPSNLANLATSSMFVSLSPCRVADTRQSGVNGSPSLAAGSTRSFNLRSSNCGSIVNASAYSINITAIPKAASLGYLTVWPTGQSRPLVSTLNSFTGTVVANSAIVPAGTNGEISIFATDATDVVIDVNGYFVTGTPLNGTRYNALSPCRVSDSRNPTGPFGGPVLGATSTRTFAMPQSPCGIPSNATAYVLNATVVPSSALAFLTIWPSGAFQPIVSTLNAFDGTVTSNALIVPAGVAGGINSYVTDSTHLILDANGYFTP